MADDPRPPISADATVGRGAAALGRWPDREDLRRARAARAWLNRGRPSPDPAVARQVLVEYRRTTRTSARFAAWWMKALAVAFAVVLAAGLVSEALGGAAARSMVGSVGFLLFVSSSLVLVPWIEARRAPQMEQAAAEARALLDCSGRS